jgi:uncharacterized protein YecE (DUF72 family)
MHTTASFYLRLHGNPVLFQSSYDTSDLEQFFQAIPENMTEICVYFNNTTFEAGYTNAMQLQKIAADKNPG